MRYEPLKEITEKEFQDLIATHDEKRISDAILRAAFYGVCPATVCEICHELLTTESDVDTRYTAALSLGHLGRLQLLTDVDETLNILRPLQADKQLGGRVYDAIDDIKLFNKRRDS